MSEAELVEMGLNRDEDLKCKSCAAPLFLVLQMDCPWSGEEGFFDRVMYVFGCNSRICTESQGSKAWTAFVIQLPSQKVKDAAKEKPQQVNLWDAVMLGASDKPKAQSIAEEVSELTIKDASFYDKSYPVGFTPMRLHICEEMIYEETKKRVTEVEESIPAAFAVNEGEEWVGEAYESSHPMGVDKAFLAFQKRVSSYPRQCVRFSPTGKPLLFHQESLGSAGTCATCGQERVFELQLMPAILSLLPCNEEKHLSHLKAEQRGQHPIFGDAMEWGTVMVFTCGTCSRSPKPTLIRASTHTQIESV